MAGVFPKFDITSESMMIKPNDTFILYTDGVTEAFNTRGELFEDERLIECLSSQSGKNAAQIISGLLDAVRKHSGDAPQSDDITLIAVRYAP